MDAFVALYIFLLAVVVAYLISSKVPAIFQNSLLSGASFINGVILIAAMIVMGNAETNTQIILGFIAIAFASANAVGSYVLTARLLQLFNKNDESGEK